jgi:hypothetical protein
MLRQSQGVMLTHRAALSPLSDARIETFREPAVGRSEKLASLVPLALIREARRVAANIAKLPEPLDGCANED